MFKLLQKIGKAFMLPIAILPAAGLLLGIGGALSNPTTVATYPLLNNPSLQAIFQVMSSAGEIVFVNLSLLLCVGLCIGLAKRDKGTAALAGVTGYLVMKATIGALVKLNMAEGSAIDTGVIGAIAVGACAVWLHNRYHNIQLPQVLGFFGGLPLRAYRDILCLNLLRGRLLPNLATIPTMASINRGLHFPSRSAGDLPLRIPHASLRGGRLAPHDLPNVLVH